MPAKSKQQQKFMGIVRAIQQGDEPASKFSKSAQDAAEDMKEKDVEDFASTKHKGLPKKVEQHLRQQIRKSVEELLKKEDYVETCGYTQSVDGKKLKTPGGTGEEDRELKEATVTFRGAKGKSVVVPNEYVGKLGRVQYKLMKMLGYTGGKHNIIGDWNWGYNSRQKMKPNDEFSSSIILRSHPYIKGGRRELQKGDVKAVIVTLNKLLRANGLKIEKSKSIIYRPDRNNPMIEFRVEPRQFRESVEEERDYKAEYKKYGSSTKAKKYRAELNQYNRKNGTYGNGDGKDASHKGGKIVGFEKESTNRGRAEKSRLKKESVVKEARRITRGNRGVKVGDTVKFFDRDRNPAHYRGKVKWIMKAKKNKEFVDFIYITAKGNYTDQHLDGTKAYKWHYRRREGVNEALRPSDRKVIMVIGREYLQQLHKRVGNPKVWKSRLEKVKDATIDVLSSMGRPEDPRYKKRKSIHKHTTLKKYNDKLLSRLSKGFDSEPTNVKRKFVDKLFKYSFKESVNEGMTSSQGKEVLRQLGGGRFIAMTGAKNFGTDGKSLTFKIGRNSKGVNFVRIKLTSMDLYDIEFLQVRAGKIKIKSKAKRVYADQLGKMFKKNTGMNVRL